MNEKTEITRREYLEASKKKLLYELDTIISELASLPPDPEEIKIEEQPVVVLSEPTLGDYCNWLLEVNKELWKKNAGLQLGKRIHHPLKRMVNTIMTNIYDERTVDMIMSYNELSKYYAERMTDFKLADIPLKYVTEILLLSLPNVGRDNTIPIIQTLQEFQTIYEAVPIEQVTPIYQFEFSDEDGNEERSDW